jgi:hypothetical protein
VAAQPWRSSLAYRAVVRQVGSSGRVAGSVVNSLYAFASFGIWIR